MRKKMLIGNWKMNHTNKEAKEFCDAVYKTELVKKAKAKKVILGIAPSYLSLQTVKKASHGLLVASQDCHFEEKGAFTSSISYKMLEELKINCSIIGHSERRQYENEDSLTCNKKIKTLTSHNFSVIYCVGETLEEFEQGHTKEIISNQVITGLRGLTSEEIKKVVIAYEPVWSIGTGKNASIEIAQDICSYIRKVVNKEYGKSIGNKMLILYGGSVKPENIGGYLSSKDVDGALVGGASLKSDSFEALLNNIN